MFTRMKWVFIAATLLLSTVPGWSQDANLRRLVRFQIKPDMIAEFLAAVEADAKALKKMNHPRRQTWWQSTTGPSEVILVRYYKSFADMDESATTLSGEVVAARSRIMKCISSQETVVDELIPEASVRPDMNYMPKYVRILRSTVKPDKMAEYEAIVKTEVAPVLKKAQVKLYMASRVRYGQTMNQFATVTGMDSMAAFDETLPLEKAMGKAAYDKLVARIYPLLTGAETTIYRSLPAQNYLPEAK